MAKIGQNPLVLISPTHATANTQYILYTGITISTEPASVSAVENQIVFGLSSDIISGASQVRFRLPIGAISAPTSGTYFTLSARTANSFPTFTLTAADEPGANEFYSSTTSPTRTLSEVGLSIAAALNANFAFRERFYANSVAGAVFIESLEFGAKWNMDFTDFGTGYGIVAASPPLDYQDGFDVTFGQSKKDYSIYADLFINSNGSLGTSLDKTESIRIASQEIDYDESNQFYFDVSGALKPYVSTPLPTLSGTEIERASEPLVNYYMVIGDRYDEFSNGYRRPFFRGQTSVGWALNSSLTLNDYNDLGPYTFDNDASDQESKYLTNQPLTKLTRKNAQEYLSILYSNSNGSQISDMRFTASIDVQYMDGSDDLDFHRILPTSVANNAGGYYTIDVSPHRIFEDSSTVVAGLLVRGYTVNLWMASGSAYTPHYQVGESRSYKFLHDCPENINQIYFLNSLGGWDTWQFTGEEQVTMDRKISTFTQPIGYFPNVEDKVNIINSIDISKVHTLYSGIVRIDHFNCLFEIGKSSDVRLKVDDTLIPIIVTKVSEYKGAPTNDLFGIAIEYIRSCDENYIKQ